MNTERLNKILSDLQSELTKKLTLQKLQAVRDHLTNQVNQPQQPAHQTNLVEALKQLNTNLSSSIYNEFSPSWRQIVDEIGGENLFGNDLKKSIEEIFSRNQITPANALKEINEIVARFEKLNNAISEIVSGFTKVKMGKEELQPGECELGYCIPRNAVDNQLKALTKEVSELNFILGAFSEAVTGEKEDFEVKTISSSDFLFYILLSAPIASAIATAIDKIINNYKTILEIKVLRNQLKEKGVPETETKGIETFANNSMEELIKKTANEILNAQNKIKDKHRKNELENAMVIALNKIANRIDKGFNIEVRVELLPPPVDKAQENKEYEEKQSVLKAIQSKTKTLEFINTSGKPILGLNENEETKDTIK